MEEELYTGLPQQAGAFFGEHKKSELSSVPHLRPKVIKLSGHQCVVPGKSETRPNSPKKDYLHRFLSTLWMFQQA
jgi:hypothetical protein